MTMIGNLENQAETIGSKAGISPDKVKHIGQTMQSKMKAGSNPKQAMEATAKEEGLPVDKVKEVLGHAGMSGDSLSGMAKGFFG